MSRRGGHASGRPTQGAPVPGARLPFLPAAPMLLGPRGAAAPLTPNPACRSSPATCRTAAAPSTATSVVTHIGNTTSNYLGAEGAIASADFDDEESILAEFPVPRGETAGATIVLDGVTVQAGDRDLLSDVEWRLMPGHRAGLVGANGCGKSTLLRCLAGLRPVDVGSARVAERVQVGYLEQTAVGGSRRTVWQEARSRMTGLVTAERAMRRAERELEQGGCGAAAGWGGGGAAAGAGRQRGRCCVALQSSDKGARVLRLVWGWGWV